MNDAVQRALQWPAWIRTDDDVRVIRERLAEVVNEARSLVERAERADRGLTSEEAQAFDELDREADRLRAELPAL